MKSNITLKKTAKPYLWIVIFVISLIMIFKLLPKPASSLTIFNNNSEIEASQCPTLTPIESNKKASEYKLKSPFTLLNWNIYKQQKYQWQQALQELTIKADFITLQEAKSSPTLQQFSKEMRMFTLHNAAFTYGGESFGVNTLSKYPTTSICGSLATEPWIKIPKSGIASVYPINQDSGSLLLINLHAVNFTIGISNLKEQLKPYILIIKQHQGPIIFSGDFNTWNDQRLTLVTNIFVELGFKEVLFSEDNRSTVFGYPLDHIYFRGLKVINEEVINSNASDHNPMRVTFAFE
ncbi:endonuclease/exonuclease/phosphatase family protein [Psychromonas sp. MME2]|uniref:endonuclease/exonuclease/phosphatase family protein n=1 Tax=unclassified Psychromonas TaxID=2614957 RepID=UPI00339C604B